MQEHHPKQNYIFREIELNEKTSLDGNMLDDLADMVLFSYRSKNFYLKTLKDKSEQEIADYLEKNVYPSTVAQLDKNVMQGDFGEIISAEVIKKIRKLKIPFCKLKWKFHKDKSVFCTDILAHNPKNEIVELTYYEIKTKITNTRNKVCIKAHDSLKKDLPGEYIADYLQKFFFEKAEDFENYGDEINAGVHYDLSNRYGDIVSNPSKYKKFFEIILVIDKSKYCEEFLKELHDMPPELSPLTVTVIKIDNLKALFEKTYEYSKKRIMKLIEEEK